MYPLKLTSSQFHLQNRRCRTSYTLFLYTREGRVSSHVAVVVVVVSAIASLRFEDEDENEDQVHLLLIVRMLKTVTVMA